MCWVFVVAYRLSLIVANGLLSLWSTGSRVLGLSSCGTQA